MFRGVRQIPSHQPSWSVIVIVEEVIEPLKTTFCPIIALLALAALPSYAYLRLHPENPRYFQESTTGEAVLFAGCDGVVPTSRGRDYVKEVEHMKAHHITYGRVWHFLPWEGANAIWPWAESDTPGGYWGGRGGNKLDMDRWNPEYWNRMADAMRRCAKECIYSEIHLFDRCGLSPASNTRYGNNPWASDHNINNLEMPKAQGGDGTPDFYFYKEKPSLRKYQEAYVRKMIDETIGSSTVIYEIENEHWKLDSADFGAHYAKFVKDYIAAKYPDQPRLVSYSSLMSDLEKFYEIPEVDIVNYHYGNKASDTEALNNYIESRWDKKKAINIDEFANDTDDPSVLRLLCWTIVTSGGHFHIEASLDEPQQLEACESIRQFRVQSKWDFVHSAPNKKLVVSGNGYCMANPGKEYVFYFPKGGSVKLGLVKGGNYTARWFNTVKCQFGDPIALRNVSDETMLETPDASDWVLHVKVES